MYVQRQYSCLYDITRSQRISGALQLALSLQRSLHSSRAMRRGLLDDPCDRVARGISCCWWRCCYRVARWIGCYWRCCYWVARGISCYWWRCYGIARGISCYWCCCRPDCTRWTRWCAHNPVKGGRSITSSCKAVVNRNMSELVSERASEWKQGKQWATDWKSVYCKRVHWLN